MSTIRVKDAPVARTTDPITSYVAGENPAAREASEREVLAILRAATTPLSDHFIEKHHKLAADLTGERWTGQRLRTARIQLVRKGAIREAGRVDGASPTGHAAMTWRIA